MADANLSRLARPLMQREIRALPPCLGRDHPLLFWLALIGLAGGLGYSLAHLLPLRLIWDLAWLALGWLPLLWSTRIIARETTAHTWDVLRSTPYSLEEIVRAKLAAVLRITAPLLVFLLVGALATSMLAAFAGAWLTAPGQIPPLSDPQVAARLNLMLFMEGVQLAIGLLTLGVDFLLTIALGGLASSLGRGRGGSLAIALLGRILLSGLLFGTTYGLAFVFTPDRANPLTTLSGNLIFLSHPEARGLPVWTWTQALLDAALPAYAAQLILALVNLGLVALALTIVFWLTVIRLRGRRQG